MVKQSQNVGLRFTFESDPNVDAKVATVIVYEAFVSEEENHEESECNWWKWNNNLALREGLIKEEGAKSVWTEMSTPTDPCGGGGSSGDHSRESSFKRPAPPPPVQVCLTLSCFNFGILKLFFFSYPRPFWIHKGWGWCARLFRVFMAWQLRSIIFRDLAGFEPRAEEDDLSIRLANVFH